MGGGYHLYSHGPWIPLLGSHHRLVQPVCALLEAVQYTLDAGFCVEALEEALTKGKVEALEEALTKGKPDIFNTDQGSQFTSEAFTGLLQQHRVRISMDGKGSYNDNLFIKRL